MENYFRAYFSEITKHDIGLWTLNPFEFIFKGSGRIPWNVLGWLAASVICYLKNMNFLPKLKTT